MHSNLVIAEEVESNGKNVIRNSFDCNAAPVPVLNSLLPVQITQATTHESATLDNATTLNIQVMPNPSRNYFTLKIASASALPVMLRVTDVLGRVVDAKSQISPNSTLQIGQDYPSGTYYVQLLLGNQQKIGSADQTETITFTYLIHFNTKAPLFGVLVLLAGKHGYLDISL